MTYRISSRKDEYGYLMAGTINLGLVRKPAIMRGEYTADQICRALRITRDELAAMIESK